MKKVLIGVMVALVLIGVGVGVFFYINSQKDKPEDVFRSYIRNNAALSEYASVQQMSGTGSKVNVTGLIDVKNKNLIVSADAECSGLVSNKPVKLNITLLQNGQTTDMRINSVSGVITNSNGKELDLTTVFSKVVTKWYEVQKEDPAIKAQLDSGVLVSNSQILAPSYDATKLVDKLLTSGAYSYTSAKKEKDIFTYQFVVKKKALQSVMKDFFPNISNSDLILDTIFDTKDTLESTLKVNTKGELISEELTESDICGETIKNIIGSEATNIAKDLTGTASTKKRSEVTIPTATDVQPIDKMSESFVL